MIFSAVAILMLNGLLAMPVEPKGMSIEDSNGRPFIHPNPPSAPAPVAPFHGRQRKYRPAKSLPKHPAELSEDEAFNAAPSLSKFPNRQQGQLLHVPAPPKLPPPQQPRPVHRGRIISAPTDFDKGSALGTIAPQMDPNSVAKSGPQEAAATLLHSFHPHV